MIPELGHFVLVLALAAAIAQAFFGLAGPALGRQAWIDVTRSAVIAQFVLVSLSLAALVYAFVQNDFSV